MPGVYYNHLLIMSAASLQNLPPLILLAIFAAEGRNYYGAMNPTPPPYDGGFFGLNWASTYSRGADSVTTTPAILTGTSLSDFDTQCQACAISFANMMDIFGGDVWRSETAYQQGPLYTGPPSSGTVFFEGWGIPEFLGVTADSAEADMEFVATATGTCPGMGPPPAGGEVDIEFTATATGSTAAAIPPGMALRNTTPGGGGAYTVAAYDLVSGSEVWTGVEGNISDRATGFGISPDCTHAVLLTNASNPVVVIINLVDGSTAYSWDLGSGATASYATWHDDTHVLVYSSLGFSLYDITTAVATWTIAITMGLPATVDPGGNIWANNSADSGWNVYEPTAGALVGSIAAPAGYLAFTTVAFAGASAYMGGLEDSGFVLVVDWASISVTTTNTSPGGSPYENVVASAGAVWATPSGGTTNQVDLVTGDLTAVGPAGTNPVAFVRSTDCVGLSSGATMLQVYDIASASVVTTAVSGGLCHALVAPVPPAPPVTTVASLRMFQTLDGQGTRNFQLGGAAGNPLSVRNFQAV
jgi:hypothetical protein